MHDTTPQDNNNDNHAKEIDFEAAARSIYIDNRTPWVETKTDVRKQRELVEKLKRLYNSPEALHALGLCKLGDIQSHLDNQWDAMRAINDEKHKIETENSELKKMLAEPKSFIEALEAAVKMMQINDHRVLPTKDMPLHIVWVDRNNLRAGLCEVPFEGHLATTIPSAAKYRKMEETLAEVRAVRDRLYVTLKNAPQTDCGWWEKARTFVMVDAEEQQKAEKENNNNE